MLKFGFNVKYGKNKIEIPLPDGTIIATEFSVKYGKNVVKFATKDRMTVEFTVKYGYNEIEIPITAETMPSFKRYGLKNFWTGKVTIYNDIPATVAENRHFDRFVIANCNIQGGRVSKADGTIENIVNAKTVWTKDVDRYKEPREYALLPVDMREQFFTVQIGDFVVLSEVEDIVENSKDFATLQSKYSNNGFKITSISPNIYEMAVDNVSFTNA